jgi:hypothetical protein
LLVVVDAQKYTAHSGQSTVFILRTYKLQHGMFEYSLVMSLREKTNTYHTFSLPNLGVPQTQHILEGRSLELVASYNNCMTG